MLGQPCQVNGFNVNLCASIGMASLPEDTEDAATLLRYADIAMYRVKHEGKNGVQTFRRP